MNEHWTVLISLFGSFGIVLGILILKQSVYDLVIAFKDKNVHFPFFFMHEPTY